MKKTLPVGVENFEDMVKPGYYYVDKTMFIKEFGIVRLLSCLDTWLTAYLGYVLSSPS